MKRRLILIVDIALIMVPVGILMAVVAFALEVISVNDRGSPKLARIWRDQLNQYASHQQAAAADPAVQIVTMENGEWLFGRSQSSHGFWRGGGGTLVVKDSKGETHAFLGGHVCGPSYLMHGFSKASLAKFYESVKEQEFQEYKGE